jgi:hypothetical protein
MYASANAVSRALTAARVRKGARHTGRVRGYYTYSEGVLASGYKDVVEVRYVFDNFDRREQAAQVTITQRAMAQVVEALVAKGYQVDVRTESGSGYAFAIVSKAGA